MTGRSQEAGRLEVAEAAEDSEESQAFLDALLNGQVAGAEKVIKVVNRRFDSRARREREFRAEVRGYYGEIMERLNDTATFIETFRRFVRVMKVTVGLTAGVGAMVVAVVKLVLAFT